MKITGLFLVIFSLFAACQQGTSKISNKFDSRSLWLLRNEEALNSELNKRIIETFTYDLIPKKNEKIKDATIVVTKYDETILGQFAQLINNYDSCVVISYTFSNDTLAQKIIGFFKDTAKSCIENVDTFMIINSTKWFIIRKTPLFEILK
jgi:hypothetical protein